MSQGMRWRDRMQSPTVDLETAGDTEFLREKQATLADMLSGTAWQEICLPAIARRMEGIAKHLVVDQRSDLVQIRAAQAKYELLRLLYERPKDFFAGGLEEGVER